MKNFTNTYIFIFSAVMVVVVAALLSFVAQALQPKQVLNAKVETMQNILTSVQIESSTKDAEELFGKYITDSYVINPSGEKLGQVSVFDVDLKKEVAKIDEIKKYENLIKERRISPFKSFMGGFVSSKKIDQNAVVGQINGLLDERQLPIYICKKEQNQYYVIPLRGKGLWGPVWGYIALESDMNTIYGAVFDHKSETPGLGAEIKEGWFQADFEGKQLFQDGTFKSIEVKKGGAEPEDKFAVDAISGGTITSKGVEYMIYDCLLSYQMYFENQRNQN